MSTASSAQDTFSHTFTDVGTFTTTVTGETASGGLFSDSVDITVYGDVNLTLSSFAIDRTINVTDRSNLETVSAIIQNIGSDALTGEGAIEVGYYLSVDDIITVDDIFIGDTSIFIGDSFSQSQVEFGFEALHPGQNYQYNVQLAVKRNIPTGVYYAGAIVDYIDYYDWYIFPRTTDTSEYVLPVFSTIGESNEEDNTRLLNAYQVTVNNSSCVSDQFEDDDEIDQATLITVGSSQNHNFCFDNSDWLKFDAIAGNAYKISTDMLGTEADTQLILYDRDKSSILLFSDNLGTVTDLSGTEYDDVINSTGTAGIPAGTVDLMKGFPAYPASAIVWEAEFSGTYFIKVRTTTCDEDQDSYCDGVLPLITNSPDGVGLNTEYTISLE